MRFMPQGELVKICTISRVFHDEAISVLYRDVDLHLSDMDQMSAWCLRISDGAELAQKVRSLWLPIMLIVSDDNSSPAPVAHAAQFQDSLSRTMKALRELKFLYIMGMRDDSRPKSNGDLNYPWFYLQSQIMLGCPFRLKTFRTGELPWHADNMALFMLQQSQIQDWDCEGLMDIQPQAYGTQTSLALLPHLSIVRVSDTPSNMPLDALIIRIISGRQLTRLRLDIDGKDTVADLTDTLAVLAPCGESLTHFHFSFDTHLQEESTHSQILQNVAKFFPNLEFLFYGGISELDGPREVEPWKGIAFPQALSPFKRLSMFGMHSAYHAIRSKEFRELVERCLQACPSLERFAAIAFNVTTLGDHPVRRSFVRISPSSCKVKSDPSSFLTDSAWRDL
ncbi:hypothetical protein FIBSPDRAFT_1054553 [Athelia psychrophila]|uniref:F-box domain-containing protein n=1 Tax=Athelia psychrophila TaxID=1759441 RepID=A0A167V4Q9_9AGAM|nr:hypothetical protein FIBSPDRAFT_1054553 [Fibularhizoctonia sp. CBS 109695]